METATASAAAHGAMLGSNIARLIGFLLTYALGNYARLIWRQRILLLLRTGTCNERPSTPTGSRKLRRQIAKRMANSGRCPWATLMATLSTWDPHKEIRTGEAGVPGPADQNSIDRPPDDPSCGIGEQEDCRDDGDRFLQPSENESDGATTEANWWSDPNAANRIRAMTTRLLAADSRRAASHETETSVPCLSYRARRFRTGTMDSATSRSRNVKMPETEPAGPSTGQKKLEGKNAKVANPSHATTTNLLPQEPSPRAAVAASTVTSMAVARKASATLLPTRWSK